MKNSDVFEDDNFEEGQWIGPDICDNCSNFSERLKITNGAVLCEDCYYE